MLSFFIFFFFTKILACHLVETDIIPEHHDKLPSVKYGIHISLRNM